MRTNAKTDRIRTRRWGRRLTDTEGRTKKTIVEQDGKDGWKRRMHTEDGKTNRKYDVRGGGETSWKRPMRQIATVRSHAAARVTYLTVATDSRNVSNSRFYNYGQRFRRTCTPLGKCPLVWQNIACDKNREGGAKYIAAVSQLGFGSAIARGARPTFRKRARNVLHCIGRTFPMEVRFFSRLWWYGKARSKFATERWAAGVRRWRRQVTRECASTWAAWGMRYTAQNRQTDGRTGKIRIVSHCEEAWDLPVDVEKDSRHAPGSPHRGAVQLRQRPRRVFLWPSPGRLHAGPQLLPHR